jgi:hypothetical protein
MPINFPNSPSIGSTYDYEGIHYIYNGAGWVNKSIYGISAGTNISFANYNGTGPLIISATDTTGITSAVTSFNGLTGAVQGVSSFAGLTGTVGSGITTNGILYFDGTDVQGSALLTFDGSDILLDTSGHFDGNMLGRSEVYIKADESITEGDPVYVTGSVGASERLTVAKADASVSVKMPAAGIAAQSLAINGEGVMVISGWVRDYDTTGLTANQTLYVAAGGGLTATRPTVAGVLVQNIARVGRPNNSNGSIIVTGASRTNDVPNALKVYQYIEMPGGFTFDTVVSSFNGKTGAVQGVSAAVAGTGISVSGATGSVTITNTGVLSFNGNTGAVQGVSSINGATGAITNVAKTNVNNLFSASQTISAPGGYIVVENSSNLNYAQLDPTQVIFYDDALGGEVLFQPTFPVAGSITVTLPGFDTTLAGLAGTQTFTGNKTFSTITNFSAGLSASGATFNGSVNLQNGEFIRNTTNGRVDIMPAPSGSTHFGIYFDHTSWSYGVAFGTIRSSDGALNTDGGFLFHNALVLGNNTSFGLGNDGHYGFYRTTTGNDTAQLRTNCDGSQNSGAWALVGNGDLGNVNRSPTTKHTNPNLYIYASGVTSANDFIRFEHDSTRGLIQTGGTSGLTLIPGSGIVGISGSAIFSGNISVNTASLGRTGTQNLIFGVNAGNAITTGSSNTIIGDDSGELISSGANNTSLGYEALTALTTGSSNTAVGMWALRNGTTGNNNTAIGSRALRSNTTGSDNTAIGYYALELNQTGSANIAIGGFALSEGATSAANNIAIGYAALLKNTTGAQNVAIGRDAVRNNTTASNNVGIGYQSLYSATSGGANTGVGTNTGYRLTTGTNNTAIGYQALFGSASVTSTSNVAIGYNSMVSNTSGSYNSGIGLGSLYSLTSGQQNTAVGTESLYAITNTSNNTAVGQLALRYATQGSDNTAIGILAGAYKTATNTNLTAIGSNNVYIGSEARASGDSINNEIVIGSKALGLGANTAVIGATAQASATIYGTLNIPGGLSAAGGTFSSPISIPKLPHLTSAVFESKTTNWTPTDADNGKIFVVNIGAKSTITCTLNGLSVGVSFKILLEQGNVAFSVTGTGRGTYITLGMTTPSSTTIYCTASSTYFATDSA